jgi:exodeoxyribonuclease V gamma subunit
MFYIVPSNRQEHLLKVLIALLDSDYQSKRLGIFEPSSIMVESLGMKHYVHMGIARESNVAMNLDFPLVSRGIYSLCRTILGDENVPKESIYKREILVWRIEAILRSNEFQQNEEAVQANKYWQESDDRENARFLLAQNTADVFEQYMQFRPQWFAKWEQNTSVLATPDETLEPWQRAIWQLLVAQNDHYPAKIIEQATSAFVPGNSELPKVLYIFVVNALTPEQLAFLRKISEQVDIYFFHLNPCVEYWGDLISEKALMHERLRKGMEHLLDEASPNSLLANLGKQGRVLFNQLQHIDYPDFTDKKLFSAPMQEQDAAPPSLLTAIQQDLLSAQTGSAGKLPSDNTVSIHSCHNHIREIQILHDFLLHIIENQQAQCSELERIQPHDIIVLCPAVEEYAPYVKSVFRSAYEAEHADNPRLVCSIADRAPLDADPMVGMFMDMMSLPDSRFSVTSLIDYLHIQSVQTKFGLSTSDVELCEKWISDANIYWAKDAHHKAYSLGCELSSSIYTWEWGLARLLKSALYADHTENDLSFAMLHNVEGQNISVLGKLMLFIQTLQNIDNGLRQPKPMQDWLVYMQIDILQSLFEDNSDNRILNTLKRAIEQVNTNINKANYQHEVTLPVAREALDNILSRPDPLNQFNTGQVTFGSMVPMRSVPFKVVCILGLNDGVFPRSSQPLSIDLMTKDTPKPTDRSRRNEDRYMFLEALVSARQYLYLSYQGRSVKDNSRREPSLVLREFTNYVTRAFDCDIMNEHPLQPFSPKAFQGNNKDAPNWSNKPSFSNTWLKVAKEQTQQSEVLNTSFDLPDHLYVEELISFFNDPLQAFSKHHLQLSFERFMDAQDDTEPFAVTPLTQSIISQHMLESAKNNSPNDFERLISRMYQAGALPEIAQQQDMYKDAIGHLSADIDFSKFADQLRMQDFAAIIQSDGRAYNLHGNMEAYDSGDTNVLYTHRVRNQHVFDFYLNHAIKRLHVGHDVTSTLNFVDMSQYMKNYQAFQNGKDTHRPHAEILSKVINDAVFDRFKIEAFLTAVIRAYEHGMTTPSLLQIELGAGASKAVVKAKKTSFDECEGLLESLSKVTQTQSFESNYLRYFFPNYADTNDLLDHIDMNTLQSVFWTHLPAGWEL